MRELNFCPYEFTKIDMDNLAYELVFPDDWDWKDVREKTVIGTDPIRYIIENDQRRKEFFKREMGSPIIVQEKPVSGEINGFDLLTEYIERKNDKVKKDYEKELLEREKDGGRSPEEDFPSSMKQKCLYRTFEDGMFVFTDKVRTIMYAIPCCPHCHNRLPLGWDMAEDFGAIALMAPSGSGKTTFLLSMMNKDWEAFQELGECEDDRRKIYITPAHSEIDEKDVTYYEMQKNAEAMCKKGGKCQDHTDREHIIPPVFLNVNYHGHTMIIGIYDNAGEELSKMGLMARPNLRKLLKELFAQIYLFDPCDLEIELPIKREETIRRELEDCRVMPIETQGREQRKSNGKRITGKELLKRMDARPVKKGDISRALEVYYKYRNALVKRGCENELKKIYFAGVIIKSDLLENAAEIRERKEYDVLFRREITDNMLDREYIEMMSECVQDMVKEFRLFGRKNIDGFRNDFEEIEEMDANGNRIRQLAISWHCVSALGCDVDTPELHGCGGTLQGEYAPIRVAEPLLACIARHIADNQWT